MILIFLGQGFIRNSENLNCNDVTGQFVQIKESSILEEILTFSNRLIL